MQNDYKREQPERFARTVQAMCGLACNYPACRCTGTPYEVEKAINAWETLVEETQTS